MPSLHCTASLQSAGFGGRRSPSGVEAAAFSVLRAMRRRFIEPILVLFPVEARGLERDVRAKQEDQIDWRGLMARHSRCCVFLDVARSGHVRIRAAFLRGPRGDRGRHCRFDGGEHHELRRRIRGCCQEGRLVRLARQARCGRRPRWGARRLDLRSVSRSGRRAPIVHRRSPSRRSNGILQCGMGLDRRFSRRGENRSAYLGGLGHQPVLQRGHGVGPCAR